MPQNNLTASVSKRMCLPLVGSASKSIPCSAVPRSQSTQLCLSRRKESVFVQLLSPPPSVRSRALSVPPSLPPSLTHSECQTQITDAVWYKRARPALICAKPSDTNLWICPKSCSVLPKAWRWLLYRPCTNSIVSALLRYSSQAELTIASTQRRAIPQLMAARHRRSISRLRIMHPTAPPSLPTRLAAGMRTCDGHRTTHSGWHKGAQRSVQPSFFSRECMKAVEDLNLVEDQLGSHGGSHTTSACYS